MKNKLKFLSALMLSVFISSSVNALEYNIPQSTILEIENRIENMSAFELKQQKASLLLEAQDLEEEISATQSPSKRKSISARMGEIAAELSTIERVLGALAGIAIANSVLEDGYKDSTAPVITVNGANPAIVELGSSYADAGASADTGEAVSSSGFVDTSTVGSYTITYTAIDSWGNIGTATRIVNVVDTTAPVVNVVGANPATVELGSSYSDAGATATDASGAVSVSTSGSVNTNSVGSYTLTYTSTDASGNAGTATRTVNVVDTTAPVVTVTGTNPATVELGASYTDAGATATDVSGTMTVVTTGTVDTDTVGAYTLTYTSTDASGNAGTATRTVNVVDLSLIHI